MILLLDLGNSRIKWATAENGEILAYGAVGDACELNEAWFALDMPERVLGCTVTTQAIQEAVESDIAQRWSLPVTWITPLVELLGIRNHYAEPSRLGADRWANLLGAWTRFPDTAQIVVSAGTALVVDALTADGDYLGGMILPGYQMMKDALAGRTARLSLTDGVFSTFPTTTADAIETGCLTAMTGAIQAMATRLGDKGQQDVLIILTGGNAKTLYPLIGGQAVMMDNLALYGLAALAKHTQEKSR